MSIRRIFFFLLVAIAFLLATGIPTKSQNPGQEIIAGRNVNMVSGTLLPLGDPFLQRQNEPSIAVSSRNPMHLFAAANDYRTIDMPHPYEPRGIPGVAAGRDAWIGVFESFDGGESFVSMLLPGFPQDSSIEGSASPIYGFDTACDPRVCAGAEGLFYLSGIAFMRNQLAGVVFVARYVDRNNREKVEEVVDEISGERKYVGPIEYVDTRIAGVGNPGQFIDMPNMAVDVPRGTAQYGNVYLAYTVFLGNTSINVRSRVVVVRSTDGGANWSKPIKLTESQHIIQRPVIAIDPSDSTGKTIYVTFRRFAHGRTPGGIAFVKSIDGGMSFTKPADVATLLCPFDQWTKGDSTITSLRTNSYPTMAVEVVDENGVPKGVPYVAWAQRYAQNGQPDPDGQSRIVFSYSLNGGLTWLDPPQLVDPYYEGDGHQFMPSTTCAGGNKTVIWYDQRDDISLHDPNTIFIEDVWLDHRHTIDVRAAEAPVGSPIFGRSILLSRYLFFMQLDEDGNPYRLCDECDPILWQGEHNYSGFPLFHLGTKPFQGDYIEVTPSPQILPPPAPGSNSWAFNTDPSEPTRSHGVWTDTRDVRPPGPPGFELWGDWINYNPPTSEQDIDFEQQNPCNNKDTTGMRNQNIYTADLNHGVIVGSPGNTKQLNRQRSFVVFVKGTNAVENRTFRLSLDEVGGVNASFAQSGADVNYLDITVPPYSSVSCTVYVDLNPNLFAPVIVNVNEGEGGPLVGRVYLNPDSNNNPLLGPDGEPLLDESHRPGMNNPKIWKYHVGNQNEPNASFLSPRAQNPRAQNSGYINPRAQNPRAQNPRAQNPRAQNPRAQNENIVNNEMLNPRAQNPRAQNTALTDMTWTVSNDGNTTSAYSFNIASDSADDINAEFDADYEYSLIAQVLVYKTHMVPIDNECELFQTHADELIANVTNPRAQNPRVQNGAETSSNITTLGMSSTEQNDSVEPITFYLAPGEEAEVIFRVYDPDIEKGNSFDDYINILGGETEAEAADTGQTEPEWVAQPDAPWGEDPSYLPEIGTDPTSLSFAAVLEVNPDVQILEICNTGGGTLDYTIADDADWLSVSPLDGTSEGPPGEGCDKRDHTVSVVVSGLALGTYQGTITITDPHATNNPVRVPVTLTIAGEVSYLKVTGNSTVTAGEIKELTITAYDASHNVATSYTGNKSLMFSGPGTAPVGTMPTVEEVDIGTTTTINFTNGVSDTGAATLIAYKAEITSVDVSDGVINSFADPSYDFDLTVMATSTNGADTSISAVSPDPVTAGNVVTITVTAYDQYQNALTSGGGTVLINVTGANTATPSVTDNSNGTYTASYTPAVTGTDDIAGTINSVAIGRDADGTSDGTYQLSVYAEITGTVRYNELPVTNYTSVQAVFWARDEGNPGQPFPISRTYDNTNGTYSIPNVPPGTYGVQVRFDTAEPFDGRAFPGDYDGWNSPIVVPAGVAVVNKDLDCQKTIHLTSPIDNINEQGLMPPPYNTHQTPVTFQWAANTEAATYQVIVTRRQSDPYIPIDVPVNTTGITDTQVNLALPASLTNQHYEFSIYAYNASNVLVGKFMIVYSNGLAWDYRFRVTPVVVSEYLSFVEQPSNSVGDQSISPAVQVKAQDGGGAPLPGVSITMGIETNPCSGTLSGGTVVSTLANGIATFSNLSIDKGEEDYTLEATSVGLATAASDPFNVEGFCDTGSLLTARRGHTATLLPNGKVLITGGQENGTILASAELYDPASGTFNSAGSMSISRQFHKTILLPTGEVLITGGLRSGDVALNSAELYDPNMDTFNSTGSMSTKRALHTITKLPNGKILISGGRDETFYTFASAELYDPALGTFSSTGSMGTPRKGHTATLLSTGKVLITGGHYTQGLWSAELYDPAVGTFSYIGNMGNTYYSHMATLLPNGKVLITGGSYAAPLAEIYDPATDIITTVAGNGTAGFTGDGGPATDANLDLPQGVAVDTAGNIFIADRDNNRIRRVDSDTGIITTVAGKATAGFSGDGGPATDAELYFIVGLAVDTSGNIFLASNGNSRIRRVDAGTGIITTVAGNGSAIYSGDGGPAIEAGMNVTGVAVDTAGNIFIADFSNHRIRRVDAATGIITTAAGNGTAGYSGDGGPATSAKLNYPKSVAADNTGNFFIAERDNHRIRRVDATDGIITTAAGNGTAGYSGDGGPATSASLDMPFDVAVDTAGNLFIADFENKRVRRVDAATGIITTVAGNGNLGFSGDGGPATDARLDRPTGVAVDTAGNLFVACWMRHRIRRVGLANGSFITTGSMNTPRGGNHTATLLSNGKVLITGGNPVSTAGASAEIYDPATGSFSPTGSLGAARAAHTATLLPDGKVLVTGGYDGSVSSLASTELFYPIDL